jgi:hypothetical protein
MTYQPFLAEAAGGSVEPRHVIAPLPRVLRHTRVLTGKIASIDQASRLAVFAPARGSPLGRLRPVTLPLSVATVTAAVLLFTGGVPAGDFGGAERLAVFRCVAGWSSQGSFCYATPHRAPGRSG